MSKLTSRMNLRFSCVACLPSTMPAEEEKENDVASDALIQQARDLLKKGGFGESSHVTANSSTSKSKEMQLQVRTQAEARVRESSQGSH
jgi:hypothetical protein